MSSMPQELFQRATIVTMNVLYEGLAVLRKDILDDPLLHVPQRFPYLTARHLQVIEELLLLVKAWHDKMGVPYPDVQ